MNRIDIIQAYINLVGAKTYLEIGVRNGDSFLPIKCERKIGVDININSAIKDHGEFYEMDSNSFFKKNPKNFDVAFIDGDHSHKQSLYDFLHCLRWANVNFAIILHDSNPTNPDMASPQLGTSANWCGEVWKTVVCARTFSSINVKTFDCDFGVSAIEFSENKNILKIPLSDIRKMTYEDLERNRKEFLNLVSV